VVCFFFQAEDGIRDRNVTGVQTCALPISSQSGVIPLAYSAGKPVVATEVGGLPEMVEHGRTGLLVPPRDAAQLADAVVRLLLDRKLRRRMGMCGKAKIAEECSPELVAQKTIDVYRRALERTAGAG